MLDESSCGPPSSRGRSYGLPLAVMQAVTYNLSPSVKGSRGHLCCSMFWDPCPPLSLCPQSSFWTVSMERRKWLGRYSHACTWLAAWTFGSTNNRFSFIQLPKRWPWSNFVSGIISRKETEVIWDLSKVILPACTSELLGRSREGRAVWEFCGLFSCVNTRHAGFWAL